MEKIEMLNSDLEKLNNRIYELRNVLNELCSTIYDNDSDKENKEDILIVSQYLDDLIVEYMKQNNKKI
ncbi:MAG TPA: Spo0E family sporulation regulatory protein-aspartic acid phosphatase [Clostridium sp.]|uniref:Spo0E family sporulation regulatory protein-aspartic acid phosphatase n=1 Tax=Clostridium sp. TaxID=1506 RepID=UPI002F92C540